MIDNAVTQTNETANAGEIIVSTRGLCKSFVKDVPVLQGIDCDIRRGEQVVVIGPSGGGKRVLRLRPWNERQSGAFPCRR